VPPGARLFEIHPRLAEVYFARTGPGGEAFVGGHRRELVVRPKPAGALRVVLCGASTVEGFPMPRHLTAAKFLEAMLRELLPERRVEVVNLGVTALASLPIREIARAAIETLEPDAVVLYEAHNEFFGAFGLASFQSLGRSPALAAAGLFVRRLALFSAFEALTARAAGPPPARRRHLIEVMAAVPEVAPDDPLHERARRSLVENFRAVLRAGRERGVPVVLSTVVSLERGLVPVVSFAGDLPAARGAEFERELSEASARLDGGAAAELVPRLAALAAEAPRHAEAAYALARALEAAGRAGEAAEAYRRARDLDAMPWRAARDKNRALRALAVEEGAPLADAEAAFAAAATDPAAPGATTFELFADHVHPNLEGQIALARSFLEALVRARLVPAAPERLAALSEPRALAERLGANGLELYAVTHAMATLFSAPPFSARNRAAAERAEARLARFRAGAGPVERAAVAAWDRASRAAGFALPISWFGAVASLRAGDLARARHYLRAAEGSVLRFGDERAAVDLLGLAVALRAGEERGALARRAAAALAEARQAEALQGGRPGALLARVVAELAALAGDAESAARARARAAELEPSAPAWQQAYLAGLPDLAPPPT
jgi:hypothetical protein